jgi:hypothetical protein
MPATASKLFNTTSQSLLRFYQSGKSAVAADSGARRLPQLQHNDLALQTNS